MAIAYKRRSIRQLKYGLTFHARHTLRSGSARPAFVADSPWTTRSKIDTKSSSGKARLILVSSWSKEDGRHVAVPE
jgi:hypothetical protein